jgi:hypothetical protein
MGEWHDRWKLKAQAKALDRDRPIREADINSGTTPALGSYEGGGGYERRQDEGR